MLILINRVLELEIHVETIGDVPLACSASLIKTAFTSTSFIAQLLTSDQSET